MAFDDVHGLLEVVDVSGQNVLVIEQVRKCWLMFRVERGLARLLPDLVFHHVQELVFARGGELEEWAQGEEGILLHYFGVQTLSVVFTQERRALEERLLRSW